MGLLKKNKHEKKNESTNESIKESPTDLLNERVLGLREELVDFKNITIKKIEKIEHLINILDEDYFELKERITSLTKEKEPKTDGVQQKQIVFLEQRISTLEKYLKEFIIFGKISIQNYEKMTDLERNFEKFKIKEPKEIILDDSYDEKEKDRFKKLEKEIDTLKNDKIVLIDDE